MAICVSLRCCTLSAVATRLSSSVNYPIKLDTVSKNHSAIYEESIRNPESFWGDLAQQRLRWMKPFDRVMDCNMEKARMSWFEGGQLNVSGGLH